jgi:histidinol-phosphatase (PHP family)
MKENTFVVDGHVHTKLCHHAVGEMEEYVLSAIDKGLKGIIFLEHYEVGINYFESTWLNEEDFRVYFATGHKLQLQYQGQVQIGMGVEVGYNPRQLIETRSFLGQYSWDRVGLSYHYYEHAGEHVNMLSRKKQNMVKFSEIGVGKVIGDYLAGLLAGIRQLPVTVVCHLDAALRHHPDVFWDKGHERQIEEILQEMASRRIALEINTAGYANRQETYPKKSIIKQARDMGVELVAGSDAHRPQDVGRYFEQLEQFF